MTAGNGHKEHLDHMGLGEQDSHQASSNMLLGEARILSELSLRGPSRHIS